MALIVEGVRTPFCRAGTALEPLEVAELGRLVLRECLYRAELAPEELDAVVVGNVAQPPDAGNVARVIALEAGVPIEVPALTVSRNCASGMEAVAQAWRLIETGEARCVMALGVESMSRIPVLFPDAFRRRLSRLRRARSPWRRLGLWAGLDLAELRPVPGLLLGLRDPVSGLSMGETAELLAREFRVSRQRQDAYALASQSRLAAAREQGRLEREIMPLYTATSIVAEDVGPRPHTTAEQLARLPPIFERRFGTVTAGNASQLTDGAVALLVMEESKARALGYRGLARLKARAVVGCQPARMGLGPAYAIPRLLADSRLGLRDVGLFEINEAFAAQLLACVDALASAQFARSELGLARAVGEIAESKLNVDGGAIAVGHPVGASGARLLLSLARSLREHDAALGLAALCVGGGQGQAMLLEAL